MNALTRNIVSAICVNPLPLIVTFRNFVGSGPDISLPKSDANIGSIVVDIGKSVGKDDEIFGASGASIHNSRKLSK